MNKYKFIKYNKNYPKLFEKEKAKLEKIVPNAKIEHIGSTSVEGLGGKGLIDILVSVPKKDLESVKKVLIKLNYYTLSRNRHKDRISFYKDSKILKKRRVHIHLTYKNSKVEKQAIKFRNLLRKNKRLRDKYSSLKQKAIKLGKKRKDYRDFKYNFIEETLK